MQTVTTAWGVTSCKFSANFGYFHNLKHRWTFLQCGKRKVFPMCRSNTVCLRFEAEPKGMCCMSGGVVLPSLEQPPEPLCGLLMGTDARSRGFRQGIRLYNSAFNMASSTAKVERRFPSGVQAFRINGVVHHPGHFLEHRNRFLFGFTLMHVLHSVAHCVMELTPSSLLLKCDLRPFPFCPPSPPHSAYCPTLCTCPTVQKHPTLDQP